MWADLSVCDLINDEAVDAWFNVSHEFHQRSSRQLISNVFGSANSTNIQQQPPSPKLPASVSKSRGNNYKIKHWEQRKYKAVLNKQHPVKTLTKGSSMNTGSNKIKPISRTGTLKENQEPKACSSVESNTSDLAKQEGEDSSSSTLTSDHSKHQEKKCLAGIFSNIKRNQ
ncbi:uncharacterized protein LOC143551312 [Bidens hawaiensis]|uniref:uncharacterized protein LOC143551312 n=1 Tax=Bidens hawaiensis TaxID=980011 RepID=UPI00404A892D